MAAEKEAKVRDTIRKEGRRLLGFIRKRVRDEDDAQDILQEVWYQLAAAVEPIEQIGGWLFQVARRKIIDLYRKPKVDLLEEEGGIQSDEYVLGWQEWVRDPQGTDEVMLQHYIREALEEALAELPTAQREVFLLHEVEGYSFQEIADRTGTPFGTLLSRKRYAVLHLRERLSALYESLQS